MRGGLVWAREEGESAPPAMLACLSPALHCKNKWKKHRQTGKKKGGKKKKAPNRPTQGSLSGLGQGLGLGYSCRFSQGSCWSQICIYHKQRQHNVIIQLPVIPLSSSSTSDTHAHITQNDSSLDSLNESRALDRPLNCQRFSRPGTQCPSPNLERTTHCPLPLSRITADKWPAGGEE